MCACFYDVEVGDVCCDNQLGYFFPVVIISVDGIVLPGTWANGSSCPLLWIFPESLFLAWVCAPFNYLQWCWWGVAGGPFLLMWYGEEWLRGNCKTWQPVRLLKMMPLCVWLWRRWWARLHCRIFFRRVLLGKIVRQLDFMLVFLIGRMCQSVMKESCHLQCIIVMNYYDKLNNRGVDDMLLFFLLFYFLVLTQCCWVQRLKFSLHNVNNKVMCRWCFELVWFILLNFFMCKFGWIVFFSSYTMGVCLWG